MKKSTVLTSLAALLLLASCGASTRSLIQEQNPTASITIQTIPAGAKVYANGKLVSTTTPTVYTFPNEPTLVRIGTKKEVGKVGAERSIRFQIVKDGYSPLEDIVEPQVSNNRGAYLFSWPENLIYELKERNDAYQKDPTIPKGAAKERVTRDTSGDTSLERTIIRWYFDSAPQGARIFWRVISSVPDEVKNTNELWLGSTPFEETRSFNIQGLTYENSRDVQIEIKVRCKGYIDQNKRFNVRQAIDQQEISSFFDMVEDPNK